VGEMEERWRRDGGETLLFDSKVVFVHNISILDDI
jgi:hypothetical protein